MNNNFEIVTQSILDNMNEILSPVSDEISTVQDAEQKWTRIEIVSALSQILDRMPREFTNLAVLSQDNDFSKKYDRVKQEYPDLWFKEKEKFRRLVCENKYPLNDLNAIWGRLFILLNFKNLVLTGIELRTKPSFQSTKAPSPFVYSMI